MCVSYCCTDHQRQHWGLHKIICDTLAEQVAAKAEEAAARKYVQNIFLQPAESVTGRSLHIRI